MTPLCFLIAISWIGILFWILVFVAVLWVLRGLFDLVLWLHEVLIVEPREERRRREIRRQAAARRREQHCSQ